MMIFYGKIIFFYKKATFFDEKASFRADFEDFDEILELKTFEMM